MIFLSRVSRGWRLASLSERPASSRSDLGVELVAILRSLSRRPILVAIGAVVAIAVGIVAAGGPTKKSGAASARVVLDTAKSQLIHQAPTGADTLPWRSVMLADLAGSMPVINRIATEVGIPRRELVVVHPELSAPVLPTTLPTSAATVAGVTSEKYVLTVSFAELLPIISLKAEAPDRGAAVRVVEAAMGALEDTGTSASTTGQIQGLVVERVGPVRSKAIVDRPQPLLGVAIAIALFCMWSAAVALIPHLLSAWRLASRRPQPA